MAKFLEKIPIVGPEIKELRGIVEAQNTFMAELEEEVKDWQALGAQTEDKDISWSDYKDNHQDCWEAYVENPIAKGYVDRLTDFVVKDGFEVVSEENQDEIDDILKVLEWESFQTQSCKEIAIFGEVFGRFFDNVADWAKVILVDPITIKAIDTDPENVLEVRRYFREYTLTEYDENGNIITSGESNKVESVDAEQIVHEKVNTVSTARRGISDLLCVLKWLTRHKDVATNLVRRSNIQMSIIGEKIITAPGASSTTAGGWKKSTDDATSAESLKRKERSVKPGTWYVHTAGVEYKFTTIPNDTRGMIDLLKMLNKIICAGFGLSEHWLGDTAESNLATATSVEVPVMAKFERRQKELKRFFEKIINKMLELKGLDDVEFDVIAPEISAKDSVSFATAIKTLCEGLTVAVTQEWISDEAAAKTVGDYLDYFESFDEETEKIEELKKMKQEKENEKNKLAGVDPLLAPPATLNPQVQPPVKEEPQFIQAIREAEFQFSKAAMDDLIKNYANELVGSFNKAKKKVLSALEEEAIERSSKNSSDDSAI